MARSVATHHLLSANHPQLVTSLKVCVAPQRNMPHTLRTPLKVRRCVCGGGNHLLPPPLTPTNNTQAV
ncbi:hypothetical protein E2C01_036380 [Portunus trituberculatus]|uniref:Uncharacterized protein n=1 Tax=Portunus trituberculatus TaxID=210409 RepID=A0A5B7FBW5_PORTR|nr:hypothetical protein [Portunus trituberculatus]